MIDDEIIEVVGRIQRRQQLGVYPFQVQAHLSEYRAEGSLRRDMARLWYEGRLYRVGGPRSRRGYVVLEHKTS